MRFKFVLGAGITTLLVGCNTLQPSTHSPTPKPVTPSHSDSQTSSRGVTITPYNPGEIKRTPVTPTVIVPKQQPQPQQNDGSKLPAFQQVIGQAQVALNRQQYAQAERLATQAQRISPQAPQSYVVLAQSALSQKKYAQAKSLAQRGLSLASDSVVKKQLQLIQQQANKAQP